jgi:hypothetical protein
MLHRNIALAANGVNSQLSGAGHGGICEAADVRCVYGVEKQRLSYLARLLL